MAVQIQIRRDTAAQWTSVNPTLAEGEIGVELSAGKPKRYKIGSGLSTWSQIDYFDGGVSAVLATAINVVSNNLSQLQSVHDVLSNRVSANSALGGGGSVTSLEVADVLSVANAASNAASIVSAAAAQGISVVSNALSNEISNRVSADNALSGAINVVSNALSQLQSVHDVLSNRVSANSAVGGGGSVTSAELNTVSARVVSVSAELASLVQIASAAATSVDGRINSVSAFLASISVLSVGGVSTHGLQSVVNALSNRISAVVGGTGSVTSQEVSVLVQTASAAATSADAHANTVSARVVSVSAELASLVQIASAAATSADGHANTVSAAANTISARVVSVSAELASLVQIASAAAASADGHANTVSAAANTISARVVSVSAELASLVQIASAAATSADGHANTVSVQAAATSVTLVSVQSTVSHLASIISLVSTVSGAGTAAGLQSVINALSVRIGLAGGGSVTSAELDAVSARVVSVSAELASLVQIASLAATSADGHANTVSARVVSVSAEVVSLMNSADAALSDRIDAIPGGGSTNTPSYVSVAQVVCAAAFTDISGLCISVSTEGIYNLQGMILFSVSAATGNAFTLVFPAMSTTGGQFNALASLPGGASTFSAMNFGGWLPAGSGSVMCSGIFAAGVALNANIHGILNVATGGVVKAQVRSSVATNAVTVMPGSFIRVFKIR